MKLLKHSISLALLLLAFCLQSHGQSQLLLPYNESIFQCTWENPAARPQHRFSVGLPALSSVEVGAINNGFTMSRVSEARDGKLYVDPNALLEEVSRRRINQQFLEASVDLLHFRMHWREWYFWFGARHISRETTMYSRDLIELAVKGNKPLVGRSVDLSRTRFNTTLYNEYTVGASQVKEKLVWGARISFLTGIANGYLRPKSALLSISDKQEDLYAHTLVADGSLLTSGVPLDENGEVDLSRLPSKLFGARNPGFALAGGVSYRPERRVNITFSFSDLGMIAWGDELAEYRLEQNKIFFDGFSGLSAVLREKRVHWNSLTDEIKSPFKLDSVAKTNGRSYTTWLSPKFHLLVTYDMARWTRAGLSFSSIVHEGVFYPSATMSIQQSYSNWVSAQVAVSYNQWSILNFGASLVFKPGPLQFYVVCDNIYGLAKPKDLNATSLRVGMNVVIGPLYPNSKLTHR